MLIPPYADRAWHDYTVEALSAVDSLVDIVAAAGTGADAENTQSAEEGAP